MLPAPVIATVGLGKSFGRQRALDNVSLQVMPGAIGLLGPNGAGKSTFMKCLLQLQPITSGSARLLGREVGREGQRNSQTGRLCARNRIAIFPAWRAANTWPTARNCPACLSKPPASARMRCSILSAWARNVTARSTPIPPA